MKAVVYERFGRPEVLELRDVPEPRPRPGELLVRVRAAALNPKDVLVRKGRYVLLSGRRFPRGVGYDWAGEAVTPAHGFAAGERLFGMLSGWSGATCAEVLCVRPSECARMPSRLSFEQAAGLPLAGQTALQALRDDARLRPGADVLILGASGGVGALAVQIARALGASVTAVTSARNAELVRGLGAERVLDYARDQPFAEPERYDAIFDVFGNRRFADAREALRSPGVFVSTVPSRALFAWIALTVFGRRRARLAYVRSRSSDLQFLADLAEAGKLEPVIDRVVGLDQLPAAHAYLETRRARGKVVVRVG